MDMPNVKQLKSLAAACRKAGIKEFKGFGFEFTLAESYAPTPKAKRAPKPSPNALPVAAEAPIPVEGFDSLSEEEKLFWSVSDAPQANEAE